MRELKCPGIYRHFKDKTYATMGVSVPVDLKSIDTKYNPYAGDNCFKVFHTEKERDFFVFRIKGYFYHDKVNSREEVVIYKSLYDDSGIYARPRLNFLSKVDKDKYPEVFQKYKFELIL